MTSGRLRAGKENRTVQRRTLKFRIAVTRMMTQTVLKTSIKNHQQQRVDKESGNMYNKNCDSKLLYQQKMCFPSQKKKRNCKMDGDSSMFSQMSCKPLPTGKLQDAHCDGPPALKDDV